MKTLDMPVIMQKQKVLAHNWNKYWFFLPLIVLLSGCAQEQVKCCNGLPTSSAPESRFDQRWNTFNGYYDPAFDK
jgi:hypothetical protein